MSAVAEANGADLSPVETAKLENLETVIQDGLKEFMRVGNALIQINTERLYRATHETFEEYCRERWDMTKQQAYRLMNATETVAEIEKVTNLVTPRNESQVRPLTRLPAEDRASAWKEAVAAAPNGKPTTAIVEEVVSRRLPDDGQEDDEGDPKPVKKKQPVEENRWEREAREYREQFVATVKAVTDGGVYTLEAVAKAMGSDDGTARTFIRMCEVSPMVKVHRTFGRKGLCQYTFEATQCVTGHARVKQLAEQIAKDPTATTRIKSAADGILSLLGG